MNRILLILPMLALLSWVACNEQQPDSPAALGESLQPDEQLSQEQFASQMMEGTLTKVDPDGKRISIRTADGAERLVSYSDLTLVTGSEDTIEGLARVNGARVKIWYTIGGQGNMAQQIEILTGQAGTTPPAEGSY